MNLKVSSGVSPIFLMFAALVLLTTQCVSLVSTLERNSTSIESVKLLVLSNHEYVPRNQTVADLFNRLNWDFDHGNCSAGSIVGQFALAAKDFALAEHVLSRVTTHCPRNRIAFYQLGLLRLSKKDYSGAREALSQAHALDIVVNDILRRVNDALSTADDKQAESGLLEIVALDPNLPAYRRLIDFYGTRDQGRAAWAIEQSLAFVRPDSSEDFLLRGQMHLFRKEWKLAEQVLTQGVKIADDNWEMHYSLGSAFYSEGLLLQSEIEFRDAVGLNPNSFWSAKLLGEVYLAEHQFSNAVNILTRANELNPKNVDTYLLRARALCQSDNRAEAALEISKIRTFAEGAVIFQNAVILMDKGECP